MSSQTSVVLDNLPVFQLKGGLYTLTAIQLLSSNLATIGQQLEQKIKQAPNFFQNIPVVIDLQKISQSNQSLDFKKLKEVLETKALIPVGVKGGNAEQLAAAVAAGLAIIQDGNKPIETKSNPESNAAKPHPETQSLASKIPGENTESEVLGSNTQIIREPVRSGQQIYARNGDLIVLAPVAPGSELLADGNIHVYGPLRGRALAGVTGDTKTHIFCQSLEAELISIAGQYKISEDIDQNVWQTAVDIYFVEERLHIRPL